MKTYFYDKEVKNIKGENKYIVYEINHTGDIDIARRKVKTITNKLNRHLAGGSFSENFVPYDFKTNYTIIIVPFSTRTSKYTKHDTFIVDFIKYESCLTY